MKESQSAESEDDDTQDQVLAAAMLLIEVAWADHEIEEREVQTIRNALTDLYGIDNSEVEHVISKAQETHESSTGIYPFTTLLNEHLEHHEKRNLLEHLWRMNTFDSEFHYEEYMIRRIADLLYCTHEEFIVAKLSAKKRLT
ncbi:MAG: TerB family tellurite resistance protein [Gammaproteobacteria bacterium]|nr:TerB family tellurite resistance protein [Gammaproteobacteria bacterium]